MLVDDSMDYGSIMRADEQAFNLGQTCDGDWVAFCTVLQFSIRDFNDWTDRARLSVYKQEH